MSEPEVEHNPQAPDDNKVEITDLGLPEGKLARGFIRAAQAFQERWKPLPRGVRWGVPALLCLLGVLLVVLPIVIPARNTQNAPSQSKQNAIPGVLTATYGNGTAYVDTIDGNILALRGTDGALLWEHFVSTPVYRLVVTSQALYYVLSGQSYDLVQALSLRNGKILWSQPLPPIGSLTIEAIDNIIYIGTHDGSVYALRASDGKQLWYFVSGQNLPLDLFFTATNGVAVVLKSNNEVYLLRTGDGSTIYHYKLPFEPAQQGGLWQPRIDSGIVYIYSEDGMVQARSTKDGALLWQRPKGSSQGIPFIDYGKVYVISTNGSLLALSGTNGSVLWTYKTNNEGFPVLVQNGIAYVYLFNSSLIALDTTSGRLLWKKQFTSPDLAPYFAPALVNGILYIYMGSNVGTSKLYALMTTNGSEVWSHPVPNASFSQPRYSNGVIYLEKDDHTIEAWNALNGQPAWIYASPRALIELQETGSVLFARSVIGTLTAISIHDGKILWTYPDVG